MQGESKGGNYITLDHFNVRQTPDTIPKNEHQQLHEYMYLETIRRECLAESGSANVNEDDDQKNVAAENQIQKKPIDMEILRQMLINAHQQLGSLLDLSRYLLITKQEAQKEFNDMHERLGIQPPPEASLQSRPFIKKRLNFHITEKQTLTQEAYDHAAHVHSLKQTLANSRSRVS